MKKLKSLKSFKENEITNFESLKIKGSSTGMGMDEVSGMTDNYSIGTSGPYNGECDCIERVDGMIFGGEFTVGTGFANCD